MPTPQCMNTHETLMQLATVQALRIFRNTESTDPFLLVAHHRHSFFAFDPFRYLPLGREPDRESGDHQKIRM